MANRRFAAMRAAGIASLQLPFAIAALFLGSLLLFAFEPYVGKTLLPSFGGTPLLWNTCVVFFQVALLLGYLYALALTRFVRFGAQLAIQLVLLGTVFLVHPAAHHGPGAVAPVANPWIALAGWLARYVLLPFIALSSLTTLVQSWLARSWHGGPYRLYAASNAGSLAGLFAYPFLLEPNLSLPEQRSAMLVLLAAVVLAVVGLMAALRGAHAPPTPASAIAAPLPLEADRVRNAVWLKVIGLTAVPSSLLLGVTSYVLTDIASVPLFWIVPLALYLTTFIVAFGQRRRPPSLLLGRVFTLLAIVVVVSLAAETTSPALLLIPLHLVTVFIGSLLCHVKVASLAPHPRWLPHYYLAIAAGGALGGIITLLVPPLLTDRFIEYPAAVVICALLLAAPDNVRRGLRGTVIDVALPLVLVLVGSAVVQRVLPANAERWSAFAYLPAAVFVLNGNTRRRVFTFRLASLVVASFLIPSPFGHTIFAERNFFGRVRVTVDFNGTFHKVVHGNTVHGAQEISQMHRCSPTTYYHPNGPAGQFFASLAPNAVPRRVALIGLGSGALACYARPGEVWDLYELNPAMVRVAEDRRLFTFLQRSQAAAKNVVLGDARLSIERTAAAPYDIVIVDAFSSDAIPIHLITKEAIDAYVRRLRAGGVLLFHISNRFFQLTPVLATVASNVRMSAFLFSDSLIAPSDGATGKYASEWVILTADDAVTALTPQWAPVRLSAMEVWTDEYSNPLDALKSPWNW
ncbi:MAG: spermidine synthase [Gemmatimonadaceae bacterium]